MGINAVEKNIRLYSSKYIDKWGKDKRSISLEPTASINENTLYIYTNLPVENIQIVVTDDYGNIFYSKNDAVHSRSHTFELVNLKEGEYTVELTIGDESFYGYFSIP